MEKSHTKADVRDRIARPALVCRNHRRDALTFVAVARGAEVAAGSAVPGIAVESHARVAAGIRLADTLAALALHPRRALQPARAAVVAVRLGIKGAVAPAVAAHVVVDTSSAAATAVVIVVPVEVDKALAIAIVIVGVAAHTFAATSIFGVRGSYAWGIVVRLSKGYPTKRPRYNRGIKYSSHFASRSLKGVEEPGVFVGIRVRHAAEEIGIALLPVRPGTVVIAKVVLVAARAKIYCGTIWFVEPDPQPLDSCGRACGPGTASRLLGLDRQRGSSPRSEL